MNKGKWFWPIGKFWTYSPHGWVLAVVWNTFELIGRPMPCAGWAFGVICGCSGRRVK